MMKGAGSIGHDEIKRIREESRARRKARRVDQSRLIIGPPDPLEGYQDWHSLVGDDDLEDNPNT